METRAFLLSDNSTYVKDNAVCEERQECAAFVSNHQLHQEILPNSSNKSALACAFGMATKSVLECIFSLSLTRERVSDSKIS